MAIRTFNSVGGFSVGENPSNVILANGDITTSNVTLTGNIAALNVKTDNYLYANGNPVDFNQAAGNTGEIQFKSGSDLSASPNLVFTVANSTISTGNLLISNVVTATDLRANANIIAGNVTSNGWANIGGVLSVTGDANVTANVNAGNLITTGLANVGDLKVGNYVSSNLNPSTDVTYDLGSDGHRWRDLWLSGGTIYLGNTSISSVSNTFTTQNANITGNLTANTLSVTSDAIITGNLTVGGNTTYINVTDLAVKDPLIILGGSANGANASSADGKDRGIIYRNYTTGPVSQFFGWKTANSEFVAIANVGSFSGEVVTSNELANIRANVLFGDLTGTVLTAAQPNITSLGTLTNANISGNLTVSQSANINTLKASGLTYPIADGTVNQVLSTYGNGTLYFNTINTDSISNGNSNVVVNANSNVTISSNGVANVFTVTSDGANVTGNLSVSGDLGVTGNLSAGNIALSGVTLGNTAINWATKTTSSVTANQTIIGVPAANIRGVIFDVTGEDAGGKYSMATVSALYNGSAVDFAVYGSVVMGGATGVLSADLSSGNITLKVSPATSNSTVWVTQYRTI